MMVPSDTNITPYRNIHRGRWTDDLAQFEARVNTLSMRLRREEPSIESMARDLPASRTGKETKATREWLDDTD